MSRRQVIDWRHCTGLSIAVLLSVVDASAQGLRAAVFIAPGGKYVEVFADGNLKTAVGQEDNLQLASGSLGVTYVTDRTLANFVVNAVGNNPVLKDGFGASLLAPASGNSLRAGLLEVTVRPFVRYVRDPLKDSAGDVIRDSVSGKPKPGKPNWDKEQLTSGFGRRFGVRWYASVSSAEWEDITAAGTEGDSPTVGAVALGAGLGTRYYFLGGMLSPDTTPVEVPTSVETMAGKDMVAVYLDIGGAFRSIGGDVASDDNVPRRIAFLRTDQRTKVGLEIGLGIQANGLKAGLTFYQFSGDIPGFSHGQVIAGFSVQSALFRGFAHQGTEPFQY